MKINGWTIYQHPSFKDQLNSLTDEVEQLIAADPVGAKKKNAFKRLVAIRKIIREKIPADPTDPVFRQGGSLGAAHTGWFRAKFLGQYRLFFRYDKASKVIVLAWVNDTATKRAYSSKKDAYKVFKGMLDDGNPPTDWAKLKGAAEALPDESIEE